MFSLSVYVSGGYQQLWRNKKGVLNSPGIHSLFSMCPGGWKAAESSNRDTLPHALYGQSSEIKGFVCTANNTDRSQFVTCQSGRMIQIFFLDATLAATTDITCLQHKHRISSFSFVYLLVQGK